MGTNIRWADPSPDAGGPRKPRPAFSLGRGVVRLLVVLIVLLAAGVWSGCLGGDACLADDYLHSIAELQDVVLGEAHEGFTNAVVAIAAVLATAVVVVAMFVWAFLGFSGRHD